MWNIFCTFAHHLSLLKSFINFVQYELHKIIPIEKECLLNKIVKVEDDNFLSGEECHRMKMNKSHNIAFPYISYHNPLTLLFILSTEYSSFYPPSYVCKVRETICRNAPSGMCILHFNCQIACARHEKLLPQCLTRHAHSALLINDDTNCML